MDTLDQIVPGILSGLAVLGIVWLARNVVPDIWLRFGTNEPRIAGKWKTEFEEDGKSYEEKVDLRQRGRKVSAKIVLEEDGEETIYEFSGTFQNLILSGTYDSTDKEEYERGAILLRYVGKGFVGRNAFFSKTSEDEVKASPYKWTRIGVAM